MDRVFKMKYAVDRIINNLAVLESLEDQTKKEVLISELPIDLKEGNILAYENDTYIKDESLENQKRESIRNKFDMLRKRKVDND